MCLTKQLLFIASIAFVVPFLISSSSFSQVQGPASGDVTVELIQGLNSAANPRGVSRGTVRKSTNPAIPVGSSALMGLGSDPVNGGYTVKLLQLGINGQVTRVASSGVVLAPDTFNKGFEFLRNKNAPKDSASGAYVFLPEKMIVRFTLTTPPSSEAAPKRAQRPVEDTKPKPWILDTVGETADSGAEVKQQGAVLEGTVSYRNSTAKAYLVMHCGFPTKDHPDLLPLETILGVNPEMLSAPGAPGAPVDLSDVATSQLGTAAAIHTDARGQNRSNGGRVLYFYDAADMQAIVDAPGQALRLSLGAEGSPDTLAQFNLPADNVPVKQVMNSCLQKSAAEAQAIKASTVASCPTKEGHFLYNVELKYSDGKSVSGQPDDTDNGGQWNFAPPVKGRSPRRISMSCIYRPVNSTDSSNAAEVQEVVIVPQTARSCIFKVAATEVRSSAVCLSIAANAPEAHIGSSTASAPKNTGAATSASVSTLPAGPTAPVNRLNVRGISVRMGRGQIIAAAKAAGMVVVQNIPDQLKINDPSASGRPVGDDSGGGGSGLILLINLKEDTAVTVNITEQGAIRGEVFEDLSKKWGKPAHLPTGYNKELGTGDKATWGDKRMCMQISIPVSIATAPKA